MFGATTSIGHGRFCVLLLPVVLVGGCRPHPKDSPVGPTTLIKVEEFFSTVAVDSHGHRVAAVCGSGKGLVLELPTGESAHFPTDELEWPPTRIALSRTGERLAIGSWKGLRIWDVGKKSVVCTLHCGRDTYTSLAFSGSDDCLYCATKEPDLVVWRCDLRSGEAAVLLRLSQDELLDGEYEYDDGVLRLAVAPDDTAIGIILRSQVLLFDIPSQSQRFAVMKETGNKLAMFSADSRKFVHKEDGMLTVRDAQSGIKKGTCKGG